MTTPFLTDLYYLLHQVQRLAQLAEERLPREIQLAHWIASQHGPSGWATVQEKFPGRQDIQAAKTLTEICAQLEGLLSDEQVAGTVPNLSLGKMRRTS